MEARTSVPHPSLVRVPAGLAEIDDAVEAVKAALDQASTVPGWVVQPVGGVARGSGFHDLGESRVCALCLGGGDV